MERYLRIADVAERTALSRTKVYELIGRGEVPSVRIGGNRRVPESLLDEWMRRQVTEQVTPAA